MIPNGTKTLTALKKISTPPNLNTTLTKLSPPRRGNALNEIPRSTQTDSTLFTVNPEENLASSPLQQSHSQFARRSSLIQGLALWRSPSWQHTLQKGLHTTSPTPTERPFASTHMELQFPGLRVMDYELSGPIATTCTFHIRRPDEPADVYTLHRSDGVSVPVVLSRHPESENSGGSPNPYTLYQAIARLPAPIAHTIKRIVVMPYTKVNQIAMALKGVIHYNRSRENPDPSEDQVLTILLHEGTHTWQQCNDWRDTTGRSLMYGSGSGRVAWEEAMRKDAQPAVTRYGDTSSWENMAEFVSVYSAVRGTDEAAAFEARHPHCCALANELLN